ncbi:MAG TPA: VWA domain-containing protein [Pyrinomonadaceae bacterium]|nr:VWA domain-containing protein [Pyrinomonadaceae bacterium]
MKPQPRKLHGSPLSLTFLIALGILSFGSTPTFAQTLIADPGTSNPTNTESGVSRQKGRKGLLFQFRFFNPGDTDAAFPLVMPPSAVVNLTIGVAPPLTCTAGINPAPGACSFVVVAGVDDPALDNVEIFFNGDFPASTQVQAQITGAQTTAPVVTQTADATNPFVVNFTTGNDPLRSPASLELVFDISGSMAWTTVPGGTASRMSTLKLGAQSFFAMLTDYAMLGDKVGVVYFSNTATVFDPTAGGTNLEPAHSATQVNLIAANIQAQVPTNATSIGDGLLQANGASGLGGDAATAKRVFLFSDGEQNVAPRARITGSNLEIVNAANTVVMTYPASLGVCPVTAGRMAAPGFALQQSIANQKCAANNAVVGDLADTFALADLNTYFTDRLQEVLIGDKLENVRNVTGKLPIGTDVKEKFSANTNDIALSILLSWEGGRQAPRTLPFRLKAPDGTVVDVSNRTQRGFGMSFTTIHFPLRQNNATVAHKGEWEIELLGSQVDPIGPAPSPLNYQVLVMLDNANLASAFSLSGNDIGTGEPIPIQVRLTENGAPATGSTVVAQLLGPNNGLGNILSTSNTPSGTPNIGGDPLASDAQRKLLLLLADPASASLFVSATLPSVVLLDNGQAANGDITANDGIYTGLFPGGLQEGHYRFNVNAQGSTVANGSFQRTKTLTVFVRPKPVASQTDLVLLSSTRQPDKSVIVSLSSTPRDRFRNLIGPDYRDHIKIRSSQGTVESPLLDKLDGSYEISYRLPSGATNPDITVEVMGTDVVTKPLSGLGGGVAGAFKRWSISLHLGSTFPHGSFGSVLNAGSSFGADAEYRFTPLFSLEAYLGHDRFRSNFSNSSFHITHLSAGPKLTFGTGTVRPSLHAGIGAYFPQGGGTRFGGNVGASVQFWVTPNFAFEPSYNYRMVNFSGSTIRYSTLQGGVRFRF